MSNLSSVHHLAILDSLGGVEVLVILVVALIVLGPEKLPQVARQVGEWAAKLKALTQNLQTEMRDVLDDPAMAPLRDLGEFAAQPRKKIAELALSAESETRAEAEARARAEAEAKAAAAPPTATAQDTAVEEAAATAEDTAVEEEAATARPAVDEHRPEADPAPERAPSPGPAPITAKWRS